MESARKSHFEAAGMEINEDLSYAMYEFIKNLSEGVKQEGIPVNACCRIIPDEFESVYGRDVIDKDKKFVDSKKKDNFIKKGGEMKEGENINGSAVKLEFLAMALFKKFLGENFIITRTSEYDVLKNGVNELIMDKASGKAICAINRVTDIGGENFEGVKKGVYYKNIENGATVKYGFKANIQEDNIILGPISGIPIFYLALPKDIIDKTINNFKYSMDEISDVETKIFNYFVDKIENQYKEQKQFYEMRKSLGINNLSGENQKNFEELGKRLEIMAEVSSSLKASVVKT